MNKAFFFLFFSLFIGQSQAQQAVIRSPFVKMDTTNTIHQQISETLDSLFTQISTGKLDEQYISSDHRQMTYSLLKSLQRYEVKKDSVASALNDKQLIQLYPINDDQYSLSVTYMRPRKETDATLLYILHLMATKEQGVIRFGVPLDYLTRHWATTKIGKTTYYHRNKLNTKRAQIFNQKNEDIATRFGLEAEAFDFYLCDDYQEILKLRGIQYSATLNGRYRDGYGVVDSKIFAIMNNEDFSHDLFHYYSGKINERANRNWITEEGLAYSWGNAYYTDPNGEMITHPRLVEELKAYLTDNQEASLWQLFEANTKIFNHLAPEISVRSTISGIIANEVERQKGMKGIQQLINSGRKDRVNSYMKAVEDLLGINRDNFDERVSYLLDKYELNR
ncbi:MAG: hypothetical protein AAGI23_22620 [Bacteroidota bacterium]